MPSNVPNKPTVDFPAPSIIVNTLLIERSSSFSGTFTPQEPGQPFTPTTHSAADAAAYANAISLGQKAGKDNEFQERAWAPIPQTQDISNYVISYSDENRAYPIFKRRYLELRDLYPTLARAENSPFTGLYAVTVAAGGTGYKNLDAVTFTGGGGLGATAIIITNPTTGAIVKITLKSEGSGYTSVPTVVLPVDGGTGAAATAVMQAPSCQLVKEDVLEASEWWNSLYHMVERTYETLPGPDRYDWEQDRTTQIASEIIRQRIVTSTVTEPTPALGQNQSFKHISQAVTEKTTSEMDADQTAAFYRIFVGNGSVDLPRVLLAIFTDWDTSSMSGSYSESGTGGSSGTSAALSLTAQGRAQGSAALLPELIPVWYPHWTNDLPVVDVYFFLPKNQTAAEVLAQANVLLSLWLGSSVTINAWPVWAPVEINLSITGQKISVSAEAVSRCSVSISDSNVSETTSSGSGTSQDKGHSKRPVNIPLCLTTGIILQNSSMSQAVTVTAEADIASGTNFPGESASASITGTAYGYVSPTSIEPTAQTGYPAAGIYGKIESEQYEDGYMAYRVRTLDFGIFPHTPQQTLVDFYNEDGLGFITDGIGQGFAISLNANSVVLGVWFFVASETQPDFSANGVTAYLRVTVLDSDTYAEVAGKVQAAIAGSYSANVTATNVTGQSSLSAVKLVDTEDGPENLSPVNTTDAVITLLALGT